MKEKVIRTSRKNERSEFVKLECVNCGATPEMVDKKHALCRYCGQRYLVDDAEGRLILDVNIKYGGNDEQTKRALKAVIVVLVVFLILAILVIKEIWEYNVPARESQLINEKEEAERVETDRVLELFCEEVFGKKYEKITQEELDSIRYISWDYSVQGDITELTYSFTDYRDCESEEEFQATIQRWAGVNMHLPMDFTMFKGLTRVDRFASPMTFSQDAKISSLCTDLGLEHVREKINPQYVEVLHFEIGSLCGDYVEGLKEYSSLKELYLTGYQDTAMDMKELLEGKSLERLQVECHVQGYTNLEALGEQIHLKELWLEHSEVSDLSFLQNLKELEILGINTEAKPDYSVLAQLPKLKVFDSYNSCLSAREIRGLQNVEVLNIEIDTQQALQELSKLSQLKRLVVHMNDIWIYDVVDISALSQLPQLQYLSMYGGTYKGVEGLYNHPTIEELWLSRNIVQTEKLTPNPNLKGVSLSEEKVIDATTGEPVAVKEFLKLFPNIEVLSLSECRLTNVSFLAEYENLRNCNLQFNKIVDFSPLNQCKKLEKVYVYDNPYEELSFSDEVKVVKDIMEIED